MILCELFLSSHNYITVEEGLLYSNVFLNTLMYLCDTFHSEANTVCLEIY